MPVNKSESAIAIFDKAAKSYEMKYMDVQHYQQSLNLFGSHISKENAQILDIACGPGNVSKYLLLRTPTTTYLVLIYLQICSNLQQQITHRHNLNLWTVET
jgi:ubiquinone/menaquinone biosynthesis C-methylase UbiE